MAVTSPKINEILAREEGLAMASTVFRDTSGEYDWMLKLSEEKYQLDMQSRLVHAKREARKEGEQRIIDLLRSGKPPEEVIREYGGN
jgi:hypothetical protein